MLWVGKDLENLVSKSLDELATLYPDQSLANLRRRQQEKRKQTNTTTDKADGTLTSTWEMLTKNAEGEAEVTTLHRYEYTRDTTAVFKDWQPATAAKITPTSKKPSKREHKLILVFGDMQIDFRRIDDDLVPIHDVHAINALLELASDLQPDEMVNLGDTLDLSSLSRFNKDSDHFYRTLGPSFQYIHDVYAQLRADSPNAKITEVDSNHHKRLTDFVLKNMPDLYNMRRPGEKQKYPVFTYPYLSNLEHVGVDWVGGYGSAEYRYKDDLVFIHGQFAVSSGSTAAKLSKANPDRNIVQGHVHRVEAQYSTDRRGRVFGAFAVGSLCRVDGLVPSYHSSIDEQGAPVNYNENWQQSVLVIEDYGEGKYQFNPILIRDGKMNYKGKEYGLR